MNKYIIRTSDRINFKSCRQAWDFGSKLRQNYEPISLPKPLDFGTAIHAGLEVFYDPMTWSWDDRELVMIASIQTFVNVNRAALKRYEEHRGPDELVREDFAEREVLGIGMLRNYFKYAIANDKFKPVYTEVEFEVPIPVPIELCQYIETLPGQADRVVKGYPDFSFDDDGNLLRLSPDGKEYWPVVYQGRIDLIVEDDKLSYWLDDHKTAGQMRADVVAHLEMDEQMKSYVWAIQKQLGIKVKGVIYNELYKGIPEPPKENAHTRLGRNFSVSMSQDTSYDLYLETVSTQDAAAYQAGLYDDFLAYLKSQGNKYFRRTKVMYNDYELEYLGYQICLEALDMFGDPLIYANPSRFKCGYCMFRMPCLAKLDGSDHEFVLREMYTQRETKQTELHLIGEPQEEEVVFN